MAKRSYPLNLLLTELEKKKLIRLAKKRAVPMSYLVRTLMSDAYAMEFEAKPLCANSRACPFPQHHQLENLPMEEDSE